MLPVLLGRQQAVQHLAAGCSSILRSCCCSGPLAALQQQLLQQQVPQQQHWQQLQQHAGFAAAAPSILSEASVLRAPPPGKSGLVVQYPFEIDYYSPRRVGLYNLDKQQLASVELPGDIFNVPVRVDVLHEVVRWQRAKARQGTHKTKDRSEVSGGGRKPWPQKGTGRARQGSRRSPQWRGGGVVHGPVPRSYAYALPKKIRRLGLKCALSAKANEGRLLLLDSCRPSTPKTKHMAEKLGRLLQEQPRLNACIVDSAKNGGDGGEMLRRAARNLPGVEIVPAIGANVYSIVRRDVLLLTKPALDALVERLRAPINRLGAAGLAYRARLEQRKQQLAAEKRAERLLQAAGQQQQQAAAQAAAAAADGSS
ncbi:ribosomal protein L4 domain-containing protein [Scenedesmus sp. NREL 46B-D3]|nr:ribosomal protein L4 domain-containing protein [Scenedesmus sp. NREL 46B-D3]